MRAGDKAWLVLGTGIAAWEIGAADGELLSEAADRWMVSHPWITRAAVAAVGLHLCNALPDRFDPLHQLFRLKKRPGLALGRLLRVQTAGG